MTSFWHINPVTRQRIRRFKRLKRAYLSLWALVILFVASLCAELVCNNRPLVMKCEGRVFFPVFVRYSENDLLHNGVEMPLDYRRFTADAQFTGNEENWCIWPLFRYDPNESVPVEELEKYSRIRVVLNPVPGVASVSLSDAALTIGGSQGMESLLPAEVKVTPASKLTELWNVSGEFVQCVTRRFDNQPDEERVFTGVGKQKGIPPVEIKLLKYKPRRKAPRMITIKVVQDNASLTAKPQVILLNRTTLLPESGGEFLEGLPEDVQTSLQTSAEACRRGDTVAPRQLQVAGQVFNLTLEMEQVRHPFRPTPEHWLGLDDAGRDVLARILYGLRTSLIFGLILVVCSTAFGTAVGCAQGYLGGAVDLLGQRAIEIWSALPFLYIMILFGSLFGTGFWLLIGCYALFNWISISYYMRAEMLRLKKLPFVEAARCLGLPGRVIVFRHILPNALVPLITFFPFSLVGAIGALAALDYLGFGLPPPTPSLGQLLNQAQQQRDAWWLIVYPSLALFAIMLLGVFVGEGVREAFDPRKQNRIRG